MNHHHRPDNRNGPYNRPPPRHMQRGGPPQQRSFYDPHEEIPPQHRRTLILSNIPPTLTFHEIRSHFTNRGMLCDFCTIDRDSGDAYVKFRERGDVLKLWEGGDGLLDGDDGGDNGLSLVNAGVKIKAIHFNNVITLKEQGTGQFDGQPGGQSRGSSQPQSDRNDQQFDRKRSWDGRDDRGGRGPGSGGRDPNAGGRGSFMGRGRGEPRGDFANKMPRHEYHSTPNQTNYNPQQGSASSGAYSSAPSHPSRDQHQGSTASEKTSNSGPASNPSNSSFYEKSPSKSSVQIHSKNSPAQTSWRRNPPASNNNPSLTVQISTLQQKLNLVSQQEATLQKQLGLQKKMLAVLKAKNDDMSKDDHSKKLKDILTTQTKIMELKKERMDRLKELQELKSKQNSGVEKKRAAAAKKKLDMRTTVLKVDGLDCDMDEESIKVHFTTFGHVTEVAIKCNETDEQSKVLYALVTFANRADAEKAKASELKFNETTLTCAWHKGSRNEVSKEDNADDEEEAIDSFNATYDDVYGEEVPFEDGGSDYAEDEEQLVDYD